MGYINYIRYNCIQVHVCNSTSTYCAFLSINLFQKPYSKVFCLVSGEQARNVAFIVHTWPFLSGDVSLVTILLQLRKKKLSSIRFVVIPDVFLSVGF